jgi:hypothetical protein
MGEVEAKKGMVTRYDLRHDRHTVSLLTDQLVFSPKYRGKVLVGEVAEAAEENIRENCKKLYIEVIDLAGKWWSDIYRGRRVTKRQILYG